MFMGLKNAVPQFQRHISEILKPYLGTICEVHLDVIFVFSNTAEELHLEQMFNCLEEYGVMAKLSKAFLGLHQVNVLGHVVSARGVSLQDRLVEKVKACPYPKTVKEMRGFLGLTGYYRRFIKDYASMATPLTDMTKKNSHVHDTPDGRAAFERLKTIVCSKPVLKFPDFEKPFVLIPDTSLHHIGMVIEQTDDHGRMHPVRFDSVRLNPAEQNYGATERECLGAVTMMKKHRHYLTNHPDSKLVVDCAALVWLFRKEKPTGKFARWILAVQEFIPQMIEHRAGKDIPVADALSRPPFVFLGEEGSSIHAGTIGLPILDKSNIPLLRIDPEFRTIIALRLNEDIDKARKGELRVEELKRAKDSQHQYIILENNLYHLWWPQENKKSSPTRYQRVIPKEWRDLILEYHHDSPLGGHFGVEKTYDRMVQQYFWPGMQKDVKQHYRNCEICERSKPASRARAGRLQPIVPLKRGERINIDLIELDKSHRGNKYALTCVEALTKFPFAIPIPDKSAGTVARALFDNVLGVIGIPEYITSDNGSEFVNSTMKALVQYLGMKHLLSTAYHPQSNGLVERFNRTLKEGLRKLCEKHKDDWDLYVQPFIKAYRDTPHVVTGRSPFELMFGYLPRNLGTVQTSSKMANREWLENMALTEQEAHEDIDRYAEKNRKYYDERVKPKLHVFKPGDLCKIKNHRYVTGARKLNANWYGPFEVEEEIKEDVYHVRFADGYSKKTLKVNISNMAPWSPNTTVEAKGDNYEIDCLKKHCWKKGSVEFRVGWLGYTRQDDTWVTLDDLNAPLLLAEYLRLLMFKSP